MAHAAWGTNGILKALRGVAPIETQRTSLARFDSLPSGHSILD